MTTLLVLLCQSTVLLLLGFLALHLTQKRGPAVQTLVGRATLSGVALLLLLLPLSGRIAPVWRIRPPALQSAPLLRGPILGSRKDVGALLAAPSSLPPVSTADAAEPAHQKGAGIIKGAASSAPTPPPAATLHPYFRKDPAIRSNAGRHTEERGSKAVGLPALLLLLWLALCHCQLIRLRRTAKLITDGPAAEMLAELTPHPPLLLTHPSVQSPFLAGTRRPAIFLPPTFAADFTPDALRAVFLHELAHRDRRDNLWTLAARLLTALLWFQPLLWLLGRRLEQISEDACDQAVLAAHCPPRAYAACLLSLAERPPLARSQRTLIAGVAPFRSSVGRRISRILTLGVPIMPAVTLRLRLSIAALTLAAVTGGAFLVSSAPAQIQPKPAPAVTPEILKFRAERQQDLANLKAIGLALVHYEADQPNYRLPDANHWMDEISPYLKDKTVFFDPFQPNTRRYGYAFNSRCSGKSLAAFVSPSEAVAVFDSTSNARNASDTGQSLRTFAVGDALLSNYLFEDGHVKMLRDAVQSRFTVQWDPRFVHMTPAHPSLGLPAQLHWKPSDKNTGAERVFGATQQPDPEIGQAQFLAGLTPVQGPGVVVTLRDSKTPFSYPKGGWPAGIVPPNIIHDSDINQVVNELKAAGTEAIAVNGQRLVVTSAVRSAGPALLINNTPQEPPYVIKAIGDPKTLAGALNIPGGEADQLKQYDKTMFTVQQAQTLSLPVYAGGNEPRYAKPVGAVGSIILMADRPHISLHRKQVLSALQAERSQLQAQQDERNVIINELNPQMKTQHQALIRQSKQAILPNRPAMTASEIHALIQSLQKEGKAKHLAAEAAAAQAEVQKTANLPPDNPAQIAAQEKFAPILAKLQFLTDVRNYTRKWTSLYTTEADTEAKGRRRMAGLQQQQRFSQAQITELDIRIARAERYANR